MIKNRVEQLIIYVIIFSSFVYCNENKLTDVNIHENYFIVQINPNTSTFEKIAFTYNTPIFYNGYAYLATKKEVIKYLNNNKFTPNDDRIIIDGSYAFGIGRYLKISKQKYNLSHTCGFISVIILDNTPVFKIGDHFFAIVKLKYKSKNITIEDLKSYIGIESQEDVDLFMELVSIEGLDKEIKDSVFCYKAEMKDFSNPNK